jgi:hypothetical protein
MPPLGGLPEASRYAGGVSLRNLENEEYMDIILNGCATLAERFSRIDDRLIREQLKEWGQVSG